MNSVAQYIARHCSSSSDAAAIAAGLEVSFAWILLHFEDKVGFKVGLELVLECIKFGVDVGDIPLNRFNFANIVTWVQEA